MDKTNAQCPSVAIPVRPKRQQDEWSETYLARAARAMGVRRPWRYDLEALRELLPAADAGNDDGRPHYGVDSIPAWAAQPRGAQIRVCAECFLQARYVRARWRIPSLTICTTHGTLLKDGLVEPAITSNYRRPDRRTIADAAPEEITDGSSCPTPAGLAYARQMWQQFEQAVCSNADAEEIGDHLAWALLAERLLEAVVTSRRGPGYPAKDELRHEHRAVWLGREGLTIAPDSAGVQAFVLGLRATQHRRAAIACLSRLIGDEFRRRTVMSRLPMAEMKNRLLAANPGKGTVPCGALPRAMHPVGCKSLEAVKEILGCSSQVAEQLVKDEHLKDVIKIQFGRKRYCFVPDAEVDRIRRLLASCMTFAELLEALAIDKQGYWALHDAGFLPPISFGRWRRYKRQDVSILLSRLDSVSRPMPATVVGLQPIMGEWLHMRRRPRAFIRTILDDLLAGRVPVYKRVDGNGLSAYYIDHQASDRLRFATEAHHASVARAQAIANQLSLWEQA